jgi:hypothetical protein
MTSLYESIAFASSSHRISVKINKFKFAEGFENLFDIGFGKIKVQ